MHNTTIEIIHWIWGEPELADFLRKIARGDECEYGDGEMMSLISSFVFPEDRERGIKVWLGIHGDENRAQVLYEKLTEGRKTPAGRLEWLSEAEPELIRDALLGHEGDSLIYVHPTAGLMGSVNRYRVHDKGTVYEPGWTAPSGAWGLPEGNRQVCPAPIGEGCSCVVVRNGR